MSGNVRDVVTMNTQEAVSDYICRELLFDERDRMPAPDAPLTGPGGVVDSVGLHQLISFLESTFGIEVGDLDIVPENFSTLSALFSYVEQKRGG